MQNGQHLTPEGFEEGSHATDREDSQDPLVESLVHLHLHQDVLHLGDLHDLPDLGPETVPVNNYVDKLLVLLLKRVPLEHDFVHELPHLYRGAHVRPDKLADGDVELVLLLVKVPLV